MSVSSSSEILRHLYEDSCAPVSNPGLWAMHPSLEVPAGGRGWWAYDSSPRNVEGWGKSCAGNITSLSKVPGKCQNKMCWLRSGNEKSIPGSPEANPSTSQHPSQGGELVTPQFPSAPWIAPRVRLLGSHPGLSVPDTVPGTTANERNSFAPLHLGPYHLVQGED